MLPVEAFNYVMKIHGCEPVEFKVGLGNNDQLAYAQFNNPSGLERRLSIFSVNDSRWTCQLYDGRVVLLHEETDRSCSLEALMRCMSDQYEVLRE